MSVALYRKYRPKTFAEVSGQNHIKLTLQNEIATGRLVHAYLFCGPRGTGKTTMARLLAKSANCLNPQANGEPCNQCESCEEILGNRSLDVMEIDAASHTGVDNVRENIIQNARFTPAKSKYKVFIIDEVHMLSTPAFNALLKTLEEAPGHVIFILATTEAHKVPSTVVSRCQRFDFKKINLNELIERLRWIAEEEGVGIDELVLSRIAKQSGGCVRDAESLLEQILSLGDKKITSEQAELILPRADFDLLYELLEKLVKKQTAEAIELVNKMVQDGIDTALFIDKFVEFARQVLLYKISGDLQELAREIDEAVAQKLLKLMPGVSESFAAAIIKTCLANKELFKQSHITQLSLEMTIVELTDPADYATPVKKTPAAVPPDDGKGVKEEKKTIEEVKPVLSEPAASLEAATEGKEECEKINVDEERKIIGLGLAAIIARWEEVLTRIKEKNYSMYMSLRMSKPIGLRGSSLSLGFLFELQRQRVDSLENKVLLRESLLSVFGEPIDVMTSIEPGLSLSDLSNHNSAPRQPSAEDVASEFGGTIVE